MNLHDSHDNFLHTYIQMAKLTRYQSFVYNQILYSKQTTIICKYLEDILYSLQNNPSRFNDYQRLVQMFASDAETLQTYLIDPQYIYGRTCREKNILMTALYNKCSEKCKKADNTKVWQCGFRGYRYVISKPSEPIIAPVNFIIPLNGYVNAILSSDTYAEFCRRREALIHPALPEKANAMKMLRQLLDELGRNDDVEV